MQDWYNERLLSRNRRQLILIVCSQDEIQRSKTGIRTNFSSTNVGINEHRTHSSSVRSSVGVPPERFQRSSRRQDLLIDLDDRFSLLQTKSDSKLRCLTTKRKENIEIRTSQSETLPGEKLLDHLDDETKLDFIIKSFESIEIDDEYAVFERNRNLKLLIDENSSNSFVFIRNLKEFKESCRLHNVTMIK